MASDNPKRRLRIGIDARLVNYRRGMGTYVHHLVHEFAARNDEHEFVLYVDHPDAVAELPTHPRFRHVVLTPRFYPLWEQRSLRNAARRDALDILHCPANTGPVGCLGRTRLVLTLHDVMFLMPYATLPISPSWYQRLGRYYRRLIVPRAARRASRIITVSNRSALDARSYLSLGDTPVDVIAEAPNLNCEVMADPVRVADILRGLGTGQNFVLAPGAIDPRKNTARVIEAFARARSSLGEGTRLVLFGLTPAGEAQFRALAARLGIEETVVLLRFVSEPELVGLYNGCRVFLYPSLYEGFGLPLLEALACGAAVAAADAGSLPEVGGTAVEYADPLDVDSIVAALQRADARRGPARRAEGMLHAATFTWQDTAAQTIASYEAAGG